jgi:hypothetical protein
VGCVTDFCFRSRRKGRNLIAILFGGRVEVIQIDSRVLGLYGEWCGFIGGVRRKCPSCYL